MMRNEIKNKITSKGIKSKINSNKKTRTKINTNMNQHKKVSSFDFLQGLK
jgi:hypothetical protein